jgi:ferredoxin
MRLVVDPKKCRRSGQCTYLHPELFTVAADGFPVVKVEQPSGEAVEAAEDAADLCPGGAIQLVEE